MTKYMVILMMNLPFISNAQFSRGTMFAGGTISLSGTTYSSDSPALRSSTSFSVAPKLGYFLSDRLAIGVGVSYLYNQIHYLNASQVYNERGYGVLPFVRYYVPMAKNFYFVASAQYSIGATHSTNGNSSDFSTDFNMSIALTPRVVFFPTPHFSIEVGVGSLGWNFDRIKPSDADNYHTNNFGLSAGNVALGIAWYFHNKLQVKE